MRGIYLLIGLFFCLHCLQGQTVDSLKCRWISTSEPHRQLDSLSVLPASIQLAGADTVLYTYSLSTGEIRFLGAELPDSVYICYQTLPFALHVPLQQHSLAEYDSNAQFRDNRRKPSVIGAQPATLFDDDKIAATGSLSRGISFGNTQSVFVQSALNLQLEGQLTDQINIRGQITDQQVPYQPEGNTQNLQEFDKVLIELFTDNHRLQAGDLQLRNDPGGHFLRYTKNVQGGSYEGTYALAEGEATTGISFSLTKGKFATVNIEPQEGVSGPYRLPLPGGQGFTIVLANSENVYIDGQLLQRGYQADYVIDYNLGELTFSPAILITHTSRIRVDYEYADQAYSRSLLTAGQEQRWGKLRVYTQLYRERDNPNRPLQQSLSQEDKRRLAEAGRNSSGLYLPAVDSVGYSENQLLYTRRDTVVAGETYPLYAFSTEPDEALYRLSFANLGPNEGNYVAGKYTALGQVYTWVAPIAGVPQGTHEPLRQAVAPLQRLLWSNGLDWQISKGSRLASELSVSAYDQNLYAADPAQQGLAAHLQYAYLQPKQEKSRSWQWLAEVEGEYLQADFTAIDRFRSVEFDRDWGLLYSPLQPVPEASGRRDYWLSGTLGLQQQQQQYFRLSSTYRQKPGLVNGWQHRAKLLTYAGNLRLHGLGLLMENKPQGALTESSWQRAEAGLRWELPILWPGYTYRLERNRTQRQADEFVLNSLQDYAVNEWYVQNSDSAAFRFRLAFMHQTDRLPIRGEAVKALKAQTYQVSLASPEKSWQQLSVQLQHRENSTLIDSLEDYVPPQVTTGQLRWRAQAWHNALRSELLYATGSSRELQRDFVYVMVATGEGTHTWRDDNENGQQELEEFYEALNPDERNYIRLFVPSTNFLTAFSNRLNMRLNFEPSPTWQKKVGSFSWLSHIALKVNVQLEQKNTVNGIARYLPWYEPREEKLLGNRNRFQGNLLFNPLNVIAGFDVGYQYQERKQQLSNGSEQAEQTLYYWRGRLRLKQRHNLSLKVEEDRQLNQSAYLNENQYAIISRRVRPEWSYVPGTLMQLSVFGQWQEKANRNSEEKAELYELGLEGRYSRTAKTQLSALLRNLTIAHDGPLNTPAAYILLEGYRPGKNWNWNLNLQHRLLDGLQLTFRYEGRKPDGQEIIHIGRMAVSALF